MSQLLFFARPLRTRVVAALSLVFTYLFFAEYLSPFRKMHIPFDLEGYHYPLVDFAFLELKRGRFPQWDPSIYAGQTFVGNVQAALFYPATWLLFAVNWSRAHVSYQSLQVFVIAHIWLAFLLCFVWLRAKRLDDLACVLGAGVYAYSGYVLLQMQHQGLVCAYAWFPFALWGVDQASEQKSWRPFWKVLVASSLCFLAGYPPTWFVFAVFTGAYALFSPWRWKAPAGAAIAMAGSLLLSAVQLLPALEGNARKVPELRYGLGIKDPRLYLSYLVPNFYDFGRGVPVTTNLGREYLYLGAPAFFGLIWLLRRRNWRGLLPLLGAGAVSAIILTNPFGIVGWLVERFLLISEICRDWYFLATVTLTVAALTAFGLDIFLRRELKPMGRSLAWLSSALIGLWAISEMVRWVPGGRGFAHGPAALIDPLVTLALFALGLWVLRAQRGTARTVLTVALLLGVGVDYKVFGTSMRLNGADGSGQLNFKTLSPEIDGDAFQKLLASQGYRIVLDYGSPGPLELRHYELASPQGFDPFISTQIKQLIESHGGHFRTNWEFDMLPDQDELLRLLAVRYVVTSDVGHLAAFRAAPSFDLVGTDKKYYRVFEYRGAQPIYGWVDGPDPNGAASAGAGKSWGDAAELLIWNPGQREIMVHSVSGGRFGLKEQFFPGWSATVDGHAVPEQEWAGAFQSIQVPPGEHRIAFRFQSSGFREGAWISLASAAALGLFLWFTRGRGAIDPNIGAEASRVV